MTTETVLSGVAASPGVVVAPLVSLGESAVVASPAEGPSTERVRLSGALETARAQLDRLCAREDRPAAEILDLQRALLEDPEILGAVEARIAAGRSALRAWTGALDHEIAEFRASDDATLAARAEDLEDLRLRVARLLGTEAAPERRAVQGRIVVADRLAPSDFLDLARRGMVGAALRAGSAASHTALIARARAIPLVVGLAPPAASAQGPALLDGTRGRLVIAPTPARIAQAREPARATRGAAEAARAAAPSAGAGRRVIALDLALDRAESLDGLDPAAADGIGLVRSELLFGEGTPPDEDAQAALYVRLVEWANGRPVAIRLFDIGGDKPVAGVSLPGETDPFLGLRGLRLLLARPALLDTQVRALLRAAAIGPLSILLPMVTLPEEVDRVRARIAALADGLARAGVPHAVPALGMMVEVPAAALCAVDFAVDFYSIGSNDLAQYTLAVSRDRADLSDLLDFGHPAVIELVRRVVEAGARTGRPVSLCGSLAADTRRLPALVAAGVTRLTVAPTDLARLDGAIRAGP